MPAYEHTLVDAHIHKRYVRPRLYTFQSRSHTLAFAGIRRGRNLCFKHAYKFYAYSDTYTLLFIRTSKFWPRLVVKFLHIMSLNCSCYKVNFYVHSIGLLLLSIHFGTVMKHVRHSLCSLSVSNCRKTCKETSHDVMCCVFQ